MSELTTLGINLLYEDAVYCRDAGQDVANMRPEILIKLIDRLRDAERRLQVPVKLSEWYYDRYGEVVMYPDSVEKAIKAAGFKVEE